MIEKLIGRKNIIILLLVILTIPAFSSLIRSGFFSMQDDLQAFRIHQMDKCFQDLQIPCRWVPDPGYQYGYPQFLYYPPSVYYLGELIHLFGIQFIDSVKILFVLGFIFSAITMFIFLRELFGVWPAFVGGLLYTYIPYKAVDVYVRGAMSEFWSFVFFPIIFWSSYKLIKTQNLKYLGWFALSIGCLLITHNLMSIVFLPVAGLWCLTWIILERNFKETFSKVFLGGLLGLGLAAFFLLPVVFEREYAHVETLLGGYFDYRQHFVDIKQLFISNRFGYGSSYLGPGDDLSLTAGPIHFFASLLALFFIFKNFKKERKLSFVIFLFFWVNLFVLFLIHQKSSFIWDKITILSWLQFPWRLLAVSVFLLSFIVSGGLYFVKDKKASFALGILTVILVLIFHGNFFKPKDWLDINDKEKFTGGLWDKQLTISIFDYLPIYAKFPPISRAPEKPEVLEGKAEFTEYKKGSNYQVGEVQVLDEALVRLPLFDFPGMRVYVDGKEISHWHDDCRGQEFCLGLITFKVLQGEHTLETRLNKTPVRIIGDSLTLISLVILVLIFWKGRKQSFSATGDERIS